MCHYELYLYNCVIMNYIFTIVSLYQWIISLNCVIKSMNYIFKLCYYISELYLYNCVIISIDYIIMHCTTLARGPVLCLFMFYAAYKSVSRFTSVPDQLETYKHFCNNYYNWKVSWISCCRVTRLYHNLQGKQRDTSL